MRDPEIAANKIIDTHMSIDIALKPAQNNSVDPDMFEKKLEESRKKIDRKNDIYSISQGASAFGPWAALLGMFDQKFISMDMNKDLLESAVKDMDDMRMSSSKEHQRDDGSGQNTGKNTDGRNTPADAKEIKAAVQQFLSKLASSDRAPGAAAIPFSQFAASLEKLGGKFDLQTIIDKIVEASKLVKSKEKTELLITLKPEWLGDVLLSITKSKDGLAVNIIAGNNAKMLLDSQLSDLEQALRSANINVSSLQVSVGGQNGSNYKNGKEEGPSGDPVSPAAEALPNIYPGAGDGLLRYMMDLNGSNIYSNI